MKLSGWLRNQLVACPFACPAIAGSFAIVAADLQCLWVLAGVLVALLLSIFSRPYVWLLSLVVAVLAGGLHSIRLDDQQCSQHFHNDWWEGRVTVASELSNSQLEVRVVGGEMGGNRLLASIARYAHVEESLTIGDQLIVAGRIIAPSEPLNPDVFPEREWLHRRGIDAKILVRSIELESRNERRGLSHYVVSVRQWVRSRLHSELDELQSAVVRAMVLGEKPKEAQQVVEDFRNSGTIHVFAVSGLHVMMVGSIVALVLRLLGCPRWAWVPLVIAAMFFYALVTGMRPPAMRAAIMGTVLLSAWIVHRKIVLANSVALCATVALLWNGHLLFLTGFQLSFGVLIAITLLSGIFSNGLSWISYVDPFLPRSLYAKKIEFSLWLRRKVQGAMVVGSCAWCGASPLTWVSFGLLAPLSILVSLPMVLMLYCILMCSLSSLVLGSIWEPLGARVHSVSCWMAGNSMKLAAVGAKAHVSQDEWLEGERVVIYAMPEGESAVYLGIGGGTMLDVGGESGFKYQVLSSLRRKGARLDSVVVSHADVQHYGGLALLAQNYELKQVVLPQELSGSEGVSKMNLGLETGSALVLSESARLEVIYAAEHTHGVADDRCAVLRLHWGENRILFVNDAGFRFEQWVLENDMDVAADLLVLGKHAYDLSAGLGFIKKVNPAAIITQRSAAEGEQWRNSIKGLNIELLQLEETGAVLLEKAGAELLLKTQRTSASGLPILTLPAR